MELRVFAFLSRARARRVQYLLIVDTQMSFHFLFSFFCLVFNDIDADRETAIVPNWNWWRISVYYFRSWSGITVDPNSKQCQISRRRLATQRSSETKQNKTNNAVLLTQKLFPLFLEFVSDIGRDEEENRHNYE